MYYEANHLKFKLVILMILVCLCLESRGQQKVQFTQYMFNGLVINPAYAGADEALSLTFVERNQWKGIEGAPETQTFTGHTLFKQKKIGIGLSVVNDRIGIHKNLTALTDYAYHIRTGEHSVFSMGLQAGIHNQKSNYGSLVGTGNNDPKAAGETISQSFLNFGAGLYFRNKKTQIGLSTPSLLPERMTISDTIRVSVKGITWLMFAKQGFHVSDNFDFEPSVLLKYTAGVPLSFDINANAIYRKAITVGLSYRRNESVDFLFKAQVTRQLQFGYAYDYPAGSLSQLNAPSHEIMVGYLFRYNQKNVASPR